ncbi:unnamed protein product [Aspergillus oryzae]|uniref:Unnamed protein product n=2 Tax=Aspergillus oryzae TaxID=5062 RepID=A0AAN5BXT7_ASPOZ|nr:unnamed protein product [Aspergillus oryzae]GMF87890.1 unnamed protein product [Aspergillus oryzae]GMG06382.1 unnamed protein product [Aspergillus oryzae]GMG38121.1 unnamed protein product [Aspergillus oryzae]GMG47503.1 unnamed protein product [Aspergillus oryzae var. brunneus]
MDQAPPTPPTPASQESIMPEFTPINGNTDKPSAPSPSRGKKSTATNGEKASPPKKAKGAAGSSPSKKSIGPIPTSFEAAGLSDRMIIQMRDEEGKNWGEINESWMKMTGIKVGTSTLRMRLLRLKKEIEEKFEQEKWSKLMDAIEADGGKKYPVAALQKKFKDLSKGNTHVDTIKEEE